MPKKKKSLVAYTVDKWYLKKGYAALNFSVQHSWVVTKKSPLHPKKILITWKELK